VHEALSSTGTFAQVAHEPCGVQGERCRMLNEIGGCQRVLVLEQPMMHASRARRQALAGYGLQRHDQSHHHLHLFAIKDPRGQPGLRGGCCHVEGDETFQARISLVSFAGPDEASSAGASAGAAGAR
jgi:hypothetical protein